MGSSIKIKMLLAAREMTLQDLADKLVPKTSAQNLSQKLKRDNLTENDLQDIAKACGVTYEGSFIFSDGRKI